MNLLERVNEETTRIKEYYEKALTDVLEASVAMKRLAGFLEPEINDEYVEVGITKFRIDFKTQKRAREIIRLLLEKTEIEKFIKTMGESQASLHWHYKAKFNGIDVFIGPAPSNKRCKPVKKNMDWPYWVCEKI